MNINRNINRIEVFDFDGALISTPLPDDGKIQWIVKTGLEWPHKGWWDKKESLNREVFDMNVVQEVIEAYNKVKDDDSTLKVMLTGRVKSLSNDVELILSDNNLVFDEYHYNGGDVLNSKIIIVEDLVKRYNKVKNVVLYDDRVEHVTEFKKWSSKLTNIGIGFSIKLIEK